MVVVLNEVALRESGAEDPGEPVMLTTGTLNKPVAGRFLPHAVPANEASLIVLGIEGVGFVSPESRTGRSCLW